MSEGWLLHLPTGNGRRIPSDTPIEARFRDGSLHVNFAGNLDNWRWRERGADCIEAYRVIPADIVIEAMQKRYLAAGGR